MPFYCEEHMILAGMHDLQAPHAQISEQYQVKYLNAIRGELITIESTREFCLYLWSFVFLSEHNDTWTITLILQLLVL